MFGLKERPGPGRVPISFWGDSDNKNCDFVTFQNFSGYFICILAPGNLPGNFFGAFFNLFYKIQDVRHNPMSLSRA